MMYVTFFEVCYCCVRFPRAFKAVVLGGPPKSSCQQFQLLILPKQKVLKSPTTNNHSSMGNSNTDVSFRGFVSKAGLQQSRKSELTLHGFATKTRMFGRNFCWNLQDKVIFFGSTPTLLVPHLVFSMDIFPDKTPRFCDK